MLPLHRRYSDGKEKLDCERIDILKYVSRGCERSVCAFFLTGASRHHLEGDRLRDFSSYLHACPAGVFDFDLRRGKNRILNCAERAPLLEAEAGENNGREGLKCARRVCRREPSAHHRNFMKPSAASKISISNHVPNQNVIENDEKQHNEPCCRTAHNWPYTAGNVVE